jgi:ABC-type antimicrobial peptide transport system permease subunit
MVRQRINEFDPRISILTATTMESYLSGTLERRRLVARLLVMVGVFALALAAFGIYAVVSFKVLHRASEVGIRMALGAGRLAVVRLFLKETAAVVGLGGLAGAAISIPVAYLIAGSFTGTQAVLGPVLVACLVTLSLAALLAAGVPAFRAARCDPAETLRQE